MQALQASLRSEFEAWCAQTNVSTVRGYKGQYSNRVTQHAFYVWRPAYEHGYRAGAGNLHVAVQALREIRNKDPGAGSAIAHAALERLGMLGKREMEILD